RVTSSFSGEDLLQCGKLGRSCTVVDIQRREPLHLLHVARGIGSERDVEVIQIELVVVASLDVPGIKHRAVTATRRTHKNTRAEDFAAARLEIGAFQVPSRLHWIHSICRPICLLSRQFGILGQLVWRRWLKRAVRPWLASVFREADWASPRQARVLPLFL